MRANVDRGTMDMEARDINYVLDAYLLNYFYASKNEDPKEIIFPKFPSVPHPRKPGVVIPIRYVEVDEPIVQDIVNDGRDIPETPVVEIPREETTEEDTAKEAEHPAAKDKELSPAKAALEKARAEERKPKMPPGGDIGSGHPDNMASRDVMFERKIAKDLMPEGEVDEDKEEEADIEKPQ